MFYISISTLGATIFNLPTWQAEGRVSPTPRPQGNSIHNSVSKNKTFSSDEFVHHRSCV